MQNSMASKTDLRSYFKGKAEESKPASKKVKLDTNILLHGKQWDMFPEKFPDMYSSL